MADRCDPIDRLIGLIYKSAAVPALWPQALVEFATVANGAGAHLIVFDQVAKRPISAPAGVRTMDPSYMEIYFRDFWKVDPALAFAPMMMAGSTMTCVDYFSQEFVLKNEFFQDFMLPVGDVSRPAGYW